MKELILSLILGAGLDSLYMTLFIKYSKNIKNKNILLFIAIFISYIPFLMIVRYKLLFYILYIAYIYLYLKIHHKSQAPDVFIIIGAYLYMIITCIIGSLFIDYNYWLGLIINKILLFSIFIFKDKFNKLYTNYLKLWNRNDNAKIKSITLRNSSILFMNLMILILYLCLVSVLIYYLE